MSQSEPLLRPPQQRRSRESLERALAAGTELLVEGGYEAFTITEVAKRAKVSVGSLYGRFQSKDGLFHEIQARALEAIEADTEALLACDWRALGADALVRAAVDAVAEVFRRHAALLRVMMLRGAVDPEVLARGRASSQRFASAFAAAVLTHRDAIEHPAPELAADVSFRMVYDVLARRVMYGPTFESAVALSWDALVGELGEACSAYLLRVRSERRDRSRRSSG
jgi:AcrR family transcriptional regulator